MDIVAFIAERKIEEAMENGAFDGLPKRGLIECSLHGEAFLTKWFRERLIPSQTEDPIQSCSRRR
jgi:hypothetical protein